MICFVSFELKVGSCEGCFSGEGVSSVNILFRALNYCLKKPHKTYIGDVRCDAGRVFDYTPYFVTVGLSNTVQLRLLRNYSGMLELLESRLYCMVRHFFLFFFSSSYFFSDVINTCYSTSVCQASWNQTYTKTPASPSQGLHHHGPRCFNFPYFCMTCGLEKLELLHQN